LVAAPLHAQGDALQGALVGGTDKDNAAYVVGGDDDEQDLVGSEDVDK